VLDASALLALLQDEPGAEIVEPLLETAVISAVNLSEVIQQSIARGVETEGLTEDVEALGVLVAEFTREDALIVAGMWLPVRSYGLSLADRACLALAVRLGLQALTTDRVWRDLPQEETLPEIVVVR
jgi:ribonuclease VapC